MDTRERILDAGRELLLQLGYKAVTTDAVAKHARVSKKTLYGAFPSKDALMEAILLSLLEANLARWDEILNAPASATEKILNSLTFVGEFLPQVQRQVLNQVERLDPALWARIEVVHNERLQRLKGLIAEAQAEGYIREDIDPDLWLTLLLGTVQSVITPKTVMTKGLSFQGLIHAIGVIYYEGILTAEGHDYVSRKGRNNE